MKDFGIGNSKFGMEIHENFIPHDALCSTGESLYYNFDYDTNQGIVGVRSKADDPKGRKQTILKRMKADDPG